jgi:hypothetical protein
VVDKGVRRVASVVLAALAMLAPLPARAAAAFTKGPYLQGLGSAGVTVKVELDAEAPVKVTVTDAASHQTIVAEDKEARRFHALRVAGLAPATTYEYVATSGDSKSEVGRFTTAPTDDRPFRFAVYGDSRSDDVAHKAVIARLLESRLDFLVNTGDVVVRGADPAEWDRFFAIEGPLLRNLCAFVAVGNHELVGGKDGEVAYLKYFAPDESDPREGRRLYGTFRWGNTRFFQLNAMDEWTGREREWLEETSRASMTEAGVAHRIAVLHHGPFSSGPHHGNARLGTVLRILRENKVELVLAGHDHVYERGEGGGVKYVISGGAGAPLYPRESQAPETQAFESVHHFVEISVDGDRIGLVARRAAGSIIESCSFRSGEPWSCEGGGPQAVQASPSPGNDPRPHCGCEAARPRAPGASWLIAAALAGWWAVRRRAARKKVETQQLAERA